MTDLELNEFLTLESPLAIERFFIRLRPDEPAKAAIMNATKWLSRRANGRSIYVASEDRELRIGLNFTFAEKRVLHWAFNTRDDKQLIAVDYGYVGHILQRTATEISSQVNQRQGIRGFKL